MSEKPSRNKPLRELLKPDEIMLWQGQPDRKSFMFSGSWIRTTLSSVVGMAAIILGAAGVLVTITAGPGNSLTWYPADMAISLAVLCFGLNELVVRPARSARRAQNTFYAVTNRRVLVQDGGRSRDLLEMDLREISGIDVVNAGSGIGTIYFRDSTPPPEIRSEAPRRPRYKPWEQGTLRFAYVNGVGDVHDIVRTARTGAI